MKESQFQKTLKDELHKRFPGCTVLKSDPNNIQGIPDLIVLFGKFWALLEVKRSKTAAKRPNQEYYVNKFGQQGFSSFIYPENKDEVLEALNEYFSES